MVIAGPPCRPCAILSGAWHLKTKLVHYSVVTSKIEQDDKVLLIDCHWKQKKYLLTLVVYCICKFAVVQISLKVKKCQTLEAIGASKLLKVLGSFSTQWQISGPFIAIDILLPPLSIELISCNRISLIR